MNFGNIIRIVGILICITLIFAIPSLVAKIVMAWAFKNVIIMAVLLAADVVVGFYLIYLSIRYLIVQYYGKFTWN